MLEYMVDETGVTNILGVLSEVLSNRAENTNNVEKESNLLLASDITYAAAKACDMNYTTYMFRERKDLISTLRKDIENL